MDVQSSVLQEDTTFVTTVHDSSLLRTPWPSNVSKVGRTPDGCVVLQFTDYIPWDNKYDPTSRATEYIFEFITNGVVLPIVFCIGAPSNVLNMAVFYKLGLKERINFCLFVLALSDLIYITQYFLLYSDRLYLLIHNAPRYGAMANIFFRFKLVGLFGFTWASGLISTIVACERCFCVANPLRSQTILKTKTLAVIIIMLTIVTVGVFFIVGLRWAEACVFNPFTNTTAITTYPSKFYLEHAALVTTLDGVVFGLFIPGVCCVTVTITTGVTITKLSKMAAWRKQTSLEAGKLSARDISLTRMLIGSSVFFVVCILPGIIFRASCLFIPDLSITGRYYNSFNVFTFCSLLWRNINSSFDFFIYYRFGTRFRETFHKIFGRPSSNKNNVQDHTICTRESQLRSKST